MSLVGLLQVLSLDVTRGLVSGGYGLGYDTDAAGANLYRFTNAINPATSLAYPPLAITGCTGNGVPIVVTTAYPHGVSSRGIGGLACVVSGVTGNTAANNVDADPRSLTIGENAGVLAVPTGPTTLALYGQSTMDGSLVALVGNGAYTGGGTIVPALGDGGILIGLDSVREHGSPPRINFVPTGSEFGARIGAIPNRARQGDRFAQITQREVRSEFKSFDVYCWGARVPGDAAYDFEVAEALYRQVIASAHMLFGSSDSNVRESAGRWDDEKDRAVQLVKSGHLFRFQMGINTAITLGAGTTTPLVPAGTSIGVTVQTPTPEVGASFSPVSVTPS
jgi:hypothetical protein